MERATLGYVSKKLFWGVTAISNRPVLRITTTPRLMTHMWAHDRDDHEVDFTYTLSLIHI